MGGGCVKCSIYINNVTHTVLFSLCCRMDKHIKGWFTEMNDMWPGQAMAMQVEEILHHEKSQYQDILVFKRCMCVRESFPITYTMVLDEVVQCTEPPASLPPSFSFLIFFLSLPSPFSCLSPCLHALLLARCTIVCWHWMKWSSLQRKTSGPIMRWQLIYLCSPTQTLDQ